MTTWLEEIGFKGRYTTEPIPLSVDGDGAISNISYQHSIPFGTTFLLQSSLSIDGGSNWSDWKECYQNSSIPDVTSDTPLLNGQIKFRVYLTTNSELITSSLTSINLSFVPVLQYNNIGDVNTKPEIWITKVGNGDFSLINVSNNNEEFKFTGLINNETIYVNNENEQIETSLAVTYRYSNFNDNYLDIPIGINVFKVQGNAKVQFRNQFKVLF